MAQSSSAISSAGEPASFEHYRTVLECIPHGVVLYDAGMRVLLFNAQVSANGLDADRCYVGMPMREVFSLVQRMYGIAPELEEAAWQERLNALQARKPFERVFRVSSERAIRVETRATPDGGWCSIFSDATEQVLLEEKLRQQAEQTQRAIDHLPFGLTMYDADERLILINQKCIELYEFPPEDVQIGTPYKQLVASWAKRKDQLDLPLDEFVEHRRAITLGGLLKRDRVQLADGRAMELTAELTPAGGWVTLHEDVTEQLQEENAIHEQNVRFDAALSNIKQGICMFGADKSITVVTDQFLRIFRVRSGSLKVGTPLRQLCVEGVERGVVDAELADRLYHSWIVAFDRREPFGFDQKFNDCVIKCEISPMANGGWICTAEDVTETRRLEAENAVAAVNLQQQNLRFDAALNSMAQGLCMYDADERMIVCNRKYIEIFGGDPAVMVPGVSLETIIQHGIQNGIYGAHADFATMMERRRRFFALGQSTKYDQSLADGRIIEITVDPMLGGKWITTFQDVTQQRALEAERQLNTAQLREQNFRFDAALNNMSQGLAMYDADNRLMVCNEKYLRIFGMDPAVVKPGVTLREVFLHRMERGAYRGRDIDTLMQRHIAIVRGRTAVRYDESIDGRTIASVITPLSNGGTIANFEDVTDIRYVEADRNRVIEDLQEQNRRFDAALNNMSQGLCMFDADQRLIVCNEQYVRLLSVDPEIVKPGIHLRDVFAYLIALGHFPGQTIESLMETREQILSKGIPFIYEQTYRDGVTMQLCISPMPDGGWVGTIEDVSQARRLAAEREAALGELKDSHAQFNAALDSMQDALSMIDKDFHVQVVNRRYTDLFGLTLADVRGKHISEVVYRIASSGIYGAVDASEVTRGFLARLAAGGTGSTRFLADGRTITINSHPAAHGGWTTVFRDVTAEHQAQERIWHIARHDALTGLANRALFLETLEMGLADLDDRRDGLAVLCLDLDDFKSVNDTLGHPIGDQLLVVVAQRLREVVGDDATIARLGGDEFAVLQQGEQPHAAIALGERIVRALAQPIYIEDQELDTSASIGIAIAPEHATKADDLMKCADLALYRAKAEGGRHFAVFEPAMNDRIVERRSIERDLRRALANQEFELHYQPQVNLADSRLIGLEALLRWKHPQRGYIPPSDFIQIAEETGLIMPIGEWVLREACQTAAKWPSHIRVSVNLSAAQFNRRYALMAMVTRALADAKLAPSRVELEITEAVLLREEQRALAILQELRALGLSISMDDFGTGYSSLSYLRMFPFDRIKIDRSFTAGLGTVEESTAIVKAIISLGKSLDIQTTAEGVETAQQFDLLRELGCDEAQGYFISRAQPADVILQHFARWRDRRSVA